MFLGDEEDREALKAEIEILRQCKNPNIVNYYGCYFRPHQLLVRSFVCVHMCVSTLSVLSY